MIAMVNILEEPRLEFRYGQALADPHDGLAVFGPYDADLPAQPRNINLAVVGTQSGIERFAAFSKAIASPIATTSPRPRLWPMFPGFEAVFGARWPDSPSWTGVINEAQLDEAARLHDPNRRVYAVVELYLESMKALQKRDEAFSLIVCVVPDYVHKNCRALSRVVDAVGERVTESQLVQRRAGQLEMFERWDPNTYDYSLDFRNQLKARAMAIGIPIQIIRESTLQTGEAQSRREMQLTPLADRAWNLSVTSYYKAGGKPWRLMGARDGVCYVGLAYRRRDPSSDARSACCAAQMFLDSGDGVVFLGESGAWYSPQRRQFHLDPAAASRLLKGVLATYQQQHGKPLNEIFLHCNSGIDREEFEGFRAGCPAGVNLVAVRVRQEYQGAVKLYREETRPVMRGTVWQVGDHSGYLWGSGFAPRLRTYPGGETPVPLRIDVQHGDANFSQVAQDIFSLTKLNYNACKLGDGEPVTVGFSKAVGEILVSNPAVQEARPQFKYYI